ncbi:MAG: TatD family hydrolase [Bacilli bacterium]
MLIDTHCHLEKDILSILERAEQMDVKKVIVSICEKEEIKKFKQNDNEAIFYTLGFHPSEALKVIDEDINLLKQKIIENKKVVGIGEIGLDYHYGKDDIDSQKTLFIRQLQIAVALKMPVIIHSRDATKDTIDILRKYKVKGIIHCFSGSVETAKIYCEMGFLLGIGGVLTFKNSGLKEVVKALPLKSFVLETDSPYLAPVPYRGSENEPKNIAIIAEEFSIIRNVSLEEIAYVTTKNAVQLFDLPFII